MTEPALINALRTRQIAGAGLDVFAARADAGRQSRCSDLDNVVVTPHIAGVTPRHLGTAYQLWLCQYPAGGRRTGGRVGHRRRKGLSRDGAA